ncbi:MAG: hypothetical protein WAZ18_05910 [Alphaproteobacteria bacterium]
MKSLILIFLLFFSSGIAQDKTCEQEKQAYLNAMNDLSRFLQENDGPSSRDFLRAANRNALDVSRRTSQTTLAETTSADDLFNARTQPQINMMNMRVNLAKTQYDFCKSQ